MITKSEYEKDKKEPYQKINNNSKFLYNNRLFIKRDKNFAVNMLNKKNEFFNENTLVDPYV